MFLTIFVILRLFQGLHQKNVTLGLPIKINKSMEATSPLNVLQSLYGQPCGSMFLTLLLKTVREVVSLISLGTLSHILAVILAMDSISKMCRMFNIERQLPQLIS